MELRLVVFIVTLPYLSTLAKSIRFEIQSGVMKCISDDIKINSMTVGQYSVVNPHEGHPLPEHHKIYVALFSEKGNRIYKENAVESGQFALEVEEDGKHTICFATADHQPKVNTSVELNWRSGMAAKDWPNVAKKGSIDAMELELKKMEATTSWISEEMTYLRVREEEMHELIMKTNSAMGLLSLLSLFICLSVAGVQLWHLKSFFEKRKII